MPWAKQVEKLEQQARDLATSVENARRRTLAQTNERIEALEQRARDLARFVETTRQQTLLQSDKKTEALEQKARDLADFVESLRNQTRVQTETEIAALGKKARELAHFVESVRKETRLQFETEIALLGQKARDMALFVETAREETLSHSESEVAELGKLNEELEQRVLERTEQMAAANKELEAFSYSVSHDLRAPLRAIDGFSRILLEDYAAALPDEAKGYLNLVRDNTRQMAQLVDDLLAFSRLGRLSLAKQTVKPGAMVRTCLAELRNELEGRHIEISVHDLPQCQADPILLKQVWTNLLSNAVKYTRKSDKAHIEIGCRTQPESSANGLASHPAEVHMETVYFVKDNGAGFDMKYAHKLFGVFQRLHRAADYEGTGVGLAIVQRIVNRHGGRVWAEAELHHGAVFSFTLG